MGNLDGHSTDGLTGTTGPGLILRSIFSELNRFEEARPLFQSPRLVVAKICQETGQLANQSCPTILEKFMPGSLPHTSCNHHFAQANNKLVNGSVNDQSPAAVHILQPTANLQMAIDPHIPDSIEAYPMKLAGGSSVNRIEWLVDGRLAGITDNIDRHFMWPLARGSHLARARVWQESAEEPVETPAVRFVVK
jgi:penicillin-binding protein 1C